MRDKCIKYLKYTFWFYGREALCNIKINIIKLTFSLSFIDLIAIYFVQFVLM